jgi:hypothetical protein
MRLLYLFPEEWTGRRAREVHTLSTCVALAQCGAEVTLVTAGGIRDLERQLEDVAGQSEQPGLRLVGLSRAVGPVKSASIFDFHLRSHGDAGGDSVSFRGARGFCRNAAEG